MFGVKRVRVMSSLMLLGMLLAACSGDDNSTATDVTSTTETNGTTTTETGDSTLPSTSAPSPVTTEPTTTVVDEQDLILTVEDPPSGTSVDSEWYTFGGSTLPGATVIAAGSIVVPVDPGGSWSIRLRLNPGSNIATFVASTDGGQQVVAQVQVFFDVPGDDGPPIQSP